MAVGIASHLLFPRPEAILPVGTLGLREVGREQCLGQHAVDLVEKLEDLPSIIVRESDPLPVHQFVGQRFEDIQCRLAVAGLDGCPCLVEKVSQRLDVGFDCLGRIVVVGASPICGAENVLHLLADRLPIDVGRAVASVIIRLFGPNCFEPGLNLLCQLRATLDEVDKNVTEILRVGVGDQLGDWRSLVDPVGITDVRQEDGDTVLANSTVIVRAGTRRVDDPGFVELDPHLVGLVLAALNRRLDRLTAPDEFDDGTLVVVVLPPVV